MDMVSMKRDPTEAKEQLEPASDASDLPQYPYGLRLELNDEVLEKLGLPALPAVGQAMTLTARVEVAGVSQSDSQGGGKYQCVSLQITDLGLNSEKGSISTAQKLYGGGGD